MNEERADSGLKDKRSKLLDAPLKGLQESFVKASNFAKSKPQAFLGICGLSFVLLFWVFSDSKAELEQNNNAKLDQLKERPKMEGVKQAIDPRADWTAKLSNEVESMSKEIKDLLEKQSGEFKDQEDRLNKRIEELELLVGDRATSYGKLGDDDELNKEISIRALDNHVPAVQIEQIPARKRLTHVKPMGNRHQKKDVKDYITSGSFARAVLETGVVVGTGTASASSPEPIMLRLVDMAIFSKGFHTEQIKEAILIGSCSGDISSERAKCRLESVSLKNRHGQIIEKAVEGWIIGEDGRPGIRGIVVDKSSDVARAAVLSGMLGGISQFFENQATNGIFPISPITGQQNALKAKDALKAGAFSGAGNALDKLADYAIKRAEQMSPVIVVGSGRVVDVVFKKGFELDELEPELKHGVGFKRREAIDNNEDIVQMDSQMPSQGRAQVPATTIKATKLQEKFQEQFEDAEHFASEQPIHLMKEDEL